MPPSGTPSEKQATFDEENCRAGVPPVEASTLREASYGDGNRHVSVDSQFPILQTLPTTTVFFPNKSSAALYCESASVATWSRVSCDDGISWSGLIPSLLISW